MEISVGGSPLVSSCQQIKMDALPHTKQLLNLFCIVYNVCNSYIMGCPPVRGDIPRALASGLSYVQADKHAITVLYHLHQCRPCTSRDIAF